MNIMIYDICVCIMSDSCIHSHALAPCNRARPSHLPLILALWQIQQPSGERLQVAIRSRIIKVGSLIHGLLVPHENAIHFDSLYLHQMLSL